MSHLFIVRSGERCHSGLSGHGQGSMRQLGQKLATIVGGLPVVLLTSSAPRAIASAQILSDIFSVEAQNCPCLCCPSGTSPDLEGLYGVVRECLLYGAEALVLVTHAPVAAQYPRHHAKEFWELPICLYSIDRGSAWHFDISEYFKDLKRIEP